MWRYPKGRGQSVDHQDCWIPDASFNAANVGSVQFTLEGKLLLGQTQLLPNLSHIFADDMPRIHPGMWQAM